MVMTILKVLTSRTGLVVLALGAALTWHYTDKISAVRSAEQALQERALIEAQTAEINELNRRAEVAEAETNALEARAVEAENAASAALEELEDYAANNEINHDCVVDPGFLNRLRNN